MLFAVAFPASAELKISENEDFTFGVIPYLRMDSITLTNTVDLDTRKRDDLTTYIGMDYSLGFDLKYKDTGPELFLKLERTGPYDYDVPLFIDNTLMTFTGKIRPYHGSDLLPKVKELWLDLPIYGDTVRVMGGLYVYSVGHGISLGGEYENYGVTLSMEGEGFEWRFYYCWPDVANKNIMGPQIKQEKEQGINYERSKAYFFATDMTLSTERDITKWTVQPYLGALFDKTDEKRIDYFLTPTRQELLGTCGVSVDFIIERLALSFETARNFGRAERYDSDSQDVEHMGYFFYADASYTFDKLSPHSRFIFASGNKLTPEMIENGDTSFESSKNNAFSVYSPLNVGLADSLYSPIETVPILAMGNGYGLNYGVPRPSTFLDPRTIENLITIDVGFDYSFTDKVSFTFDWWYLRSVERGVGMYNFVAERISPDLGNEFDLSLICAFNDNLTLEVYGAIFLPGRAYKKVRDDTGGSLFTPFVRGDGKADPAYQLEACLALTF